jgi:hypothetical protein
MGMTEQRAQELIVGCLGASTVIAAGSTLVEGEHPGLGMLVGVAVTGVGLATVAMFSPDLAGTFSALILTATVLTFGEPLMNAVTGITSTTASAPSRRPGLTPTRKSGGDTPTEGTNV